jgi:hypothetical protein
VVQWRICHIRIEVARAYGSGTNSTAEYIGQEEVDQYLAANEPRLGERRDVHSMNAIGERLYEQNFGHPKIASAEVIRHFMTEAAEKVAELKFSLSFLLTSGKSWLTRGSYKAGSHIAT